MSVTLPLAHGIQSVESLPIPLWLFFYGAALTLILSFVALGVLWRRPVLEGRDGGRPFSPAWQRLLLWTGWRVIFGALAVGLLALVWLAALLGEPDAGSNLAPTFVWVVFWVGLVPVVVLFGNVWSALSPWRAVADAVGWAWGRTGRTWEPAAAYPSGLGRWPAAVLLLAFATLELAYPRAAEPRTLALAIVVYSWITWAGMLVFGRRTWVENGEAFHVYFGLLSLIAPLAVREEVDGRRAVVLRPPLAGLTTPLRVPGTVAFVAVMLGSVAFDGISRVQWWQDRSYDLSSRYVVDSPRKADLVETGFNLLGLLVAVVAVALVYLAAIRAAAAVSGRRDLGPMFVGSLVPIALAYALAHYFLLLLNEGQYAISLASDPFGKGWDLLGTADYRPSFFDSGNWIWYTQVAVLVVGHVLGLALAHDRAVAIWGSAKAAIRTQLAMLVLMVVYTCTGLWLLWSG